MWAATISIMHVGTLVCTRPPLLTPDTVRDCRTDGDSRQIKRSPMIWSHGLGRALAELACQQISSVQVMRKTDKSNSRSRSRIEIKIHKFITAKQFEKLPKEAKNTVDIMVLLMEFNYTKWK